MKPNKHHFLIFILPLLSVLFSPLPNAFGEDNAEGVESAEQAADENSAYSERIGDKLGRGLENLFVFWLEIPHAIMKTGKENGWAQGSTVGVGKGLAFAVARLGVGAYELVTFPYPQDPILHPTEDWEW